jgi:hypothetical protein
LLTRGLAFSLIPLLLIVPHVELQAAEPQFRPALIGNGPKALVNLINTQRLVEKGQRDGLLMFQCGVSPLGEVGKKYFIYRETPGSQMLKEEVGAALWSCRFIPAIYNGARPAVIFAGTVVFAVRDGKPHLRIYANQNHDDIGKGNDFIAPQVVVRTVDFFGPGYDRLAEKLRVNRVKGAVKLSITVDSNGNQKDKKVVLEDPPGFGLGTAVRDAYAKAKWIPGFRNGRAVECTFEHAEWFRAWEWWYSIYGPPPPNS